MRIDRIVPAALGSVSRSKSAFMKGSLRVQLYQIEMGRIRATLEVTDGRVTAAGPVLVHSAGLPISKVAEWVKKKGGRIELLSDNSLRLPGVPRPKAL